VTITLTISRDDVHGGDDPPAPIPCRFPDDATLAQALTSDPGLHQGFTWVAYDDADKPLAAVHDGAVRYVVPPGTQLRQRRVTRIRYKHAGSQNLAEAAAVLRAGGIAGPMFLRPLLQPRNRLLRQFESHPTERGAEWWRRIPLDGIDAPPLLRFAEEAGDSRLETCIRYWAGLTDNKLWQVADRCSRVLHEHGYYERQRALETRVTLRLPPPPGSWEYEPVALGLDFAVIADVAVGDRGFRRDLDTIVELTT
jgi:hypothetical protein